MSELSEIKEAIVDNALAIVLLPKGQGTLALQLLDHNVERLLEYKANRKGLTVDEYVKSERDKYEAERKELFRLAGLSLESK